MYTTGGGMRLGAITFIYYSNSAEHLYLYDKTYACALGAVRRACHNGRCCRRGCAQSQRVDQPRKTRRFREGLALRARRLLYHSALGSRVTKRKKKTRGAGVSGWSGATQCENRCEDRVLDGPASGGNGSKVNQTHTPSCSSKSCLIF